MKYLSGILFFCFFLLSSACSHKNDSPLKEVLKLAGSNRHQLERVISHYKADPADSLKLKAAKFLILNMPGKYSEYYAAPWEDVATVNLRWSSSSDKSIVLNTYKVGNPVRKDDIKHIIPVKHYSEIQTGSVFLTLFYDFEWRLTGHGEVDSDSIRFQHIGKGLASMKDTNMSYFVG